LELGHTKTMIAVDQHAAKATSLRGDLARVWGVHLAGPSGPAGTVGSPVRSLRAACPHAAQPAAPHLPLPVQEVRGLGAVARPLTRLGAARRPGVLLEDGGERIDFFTCCKPVACLAKPLGMALLVCEAVLEVVVGIAGGSRLRGIRQRALQRPRIGAGSGRCRS
jgi:hypothetical protein